ncbi:hypothetical protein AXG93_3506s1160 [Marchantia polymorpha subsp. ruderalis]|uniref:C2H2-type domain-containing protein n=1 Tax=Marchantia polymorpha subsp. ruderalis TaxID=1480154 RepID=A0A176VM91_MARPO|nr:hypothetical protein AXG93_3506s1160 [Marchantia polymorpha subsp. ruderalis]
MVGCHEQEAPSETTASSSSFERELVTGSSCVIDADANYSEMAVSDTAAGLTAPTARQRVSDEGKKPGPSSQHRPSPDRNYSQAVSENLQAVTSSSSEHRGISRIVQQQQPGQPFHRRHTTGATSPAMGTAEAAAVAAAASSSSAEEAALDVDCVEDCGRHDASQGNSRHTCKVCKRPFSSGRALGGHMRAHGNGDPGTSSNADRKSEKQLISSSPRTQQASLHACNGVAENGIEHPGADGVARAQSLSPESRARARTREIQVRRAVGARRSKTNGKRRGSTTPKSSVEDAAALTKQQPHDEDDNAASRRQAERSSTSCSDNNSDGAHDDGAATDDAAGNICDVCREEFENEKQLNTHKKSHKPEYNLRECPRKSRRFIDQDYTEVAPPTIPTKKPPAPQEKQQSDSGCPYPGCTKKFHSSKALFGHMRCHPDRTWRGIHPPDENGASTSAAGERQHRRKKSRPNSHVPARVVSDSESEPEQKQSGKSASTEHESDTDSIEAAYIQGQEAHTNGDRQQSSTPGWWASGVTGKRSKRSRQTVRSLQAVHHGASTSSAAAPDNALEELNETAMVMMMLASNPSGAPKHEDPDEHMEDLFRNPNSADECPKDEPTEGCLEAALRAKDEEEDEEDEEEDKEEEGEDGDEKQGAAAATAAEVVEDLEQGPELVPKDEFMTAAAETAEVPMEVDEEPEASLSEDGVLQGEEAVQLEAGQQEASSSKHGKYQCATCLRFFRSHQALGGHRASHKKVKGCFARTNVGDGPQPESLDEELSEDMLRSEEQLPTELQDLSHSEGDDKDRQMTSNSKDESSTDVVPPTGSIKKGAHKCTECGRCFDSGQALGGHKRCHFDPTKKDAEKEGSSSNNGGKNPRSSNPAGRASYSQSRGRHESSDARGHSPRAKSDPGLQQQQQQQAAAPAESRSTGLLRPIEIDLNKPPTVTYDEEMEMAPSPASAKFSVENHEAQASASAEASSSPDDGEPMRNQPRDYQLILHLSPITLNLEDQLHAYYKRVTPA